METAGSERFRIDSGGSVGIAIVPKSTSNTVTGSLNVDEGGLIVRNSNQAYFASNIYWDGSDQLKSHSAGYGIALGYIPSDGSYRFFNTTASASGADQNLTLNEKVRIDTNGNVGITAAGASDAAPLQDFQVIHHSGGGRRGTLYYNQDSKVALASLNASSTWENLAIEGANISLKTGGTTNTDAVVIDSSGKVAIGHSSPGGLPLQTKVSSGDNKFRQTTAAKDAFTLGFENSTGNTIIGTHSKYPHTTFRDDGNVGIGAAGMPVYSAYTQLSIGAVGHIMSSTAEATTGSLHISQNAHFDADGSWETMVTDYASNYYQYGGAHHFRVAGSTSAGTDISFTEALKIANNGRVGVNYSNPSAQLHVKSSTNTPLHLESIATNGGYINLSMGAGGATLGFIGSAHEVIASGSDANLGIRAQGGMTFATGGSTSKMHINSTGNVSMTHLASGSGNADLRYNTGNGDVTYYTSSRLVKEDIEDVPYGLEAVKNLSPKRYKRTDGEKNVEIGFIADEVFGVVPELVGIMKKSVFTKEESDTEEIPGSVFYSQMSAVLVKAVQELSEEVTALKAEVAALKGE